MLDALNFITRGAEVKRFHTLTTLCEETVGHHSHGVALLCYLLDPTTTRDVLIAALLHDLSEQYTGDIPSPAKREYGIGAQVDALERRLMSEVGLPMPALGSQDSRTLKLADIAYGALFCVKEISLGNRRAAQVYDRYISYAQQMLLAGRERQLFNCIEEARRGGE